MDRAQKEALVASLHRVFNEATLVVVTHYMGLTVSEISGLRRRMDEAGARFRVTKNRLTRLALDGTKFGPLIPLFEGPTAIAYSADPVAAARVAVDFARTNAKLTVLGGALNEQRLDAGAVQELAALPSLDELRAKLAGLIAAPAQRLATVTQAPAGQLARVFAAYGETGEAA